MQAPLPESEPALLKNLNQPWFLFVATCSPRHLSADTCENWNVNQSLTRLLYRRILCVDREHNIWESMLDVTGRERQEVYWTQIKHRTELSAHENGSSNLKVHSWDSKSCNLARPNLNELVLNLRNGLNRPPEFRLVESRIQAML